MKLGIVILNYNDYKTTIDLVNHIKNYDAIDHLVVVDNKSSNDSLKILKKANDATWDLIASSENKGYASGNNIGIKYLINNFDVDIIGIVNPDIKFSNEFIYEIKKSFKENKEYAIITGLQLKPDGSISKRAFWKELNLKRLLISNSFILSKIVNNYEKYITKKLQEKKRIITVSVVEGCCFFINADDMKKIGFFDENTFLFCEEDILAKKIKQTNKKIGVNKKITFIHNHSTTIKKAFSQLKTNKLILKSKKYLLNKYITNNVIVDFLFKITSITCLLELIFIIYPYIKIKNINK
ncbi:glycosyltransferase family 2 protein [Megamonas funiformis]